MIFGRGRGFGRTGGFGGRRDQRRFMRDMRRGGILNAIIGLVMYRVISLVIGVFIVFMVLAACVVIAFIAN